MAVRTRDLVFVVPSVQAEIEPRGPAIRLEGSLLGPDILEQLRTSDLPGQKPQDFGLPQRASLLDEVAAVFEEARQMWTAFQHRLDRLPHDDPGTTVTREVWMRPFLSLLGYEIRFNRREYYEDVGVYPISHRAGDNLDAPPVHIVGARDALGRVPTSGRARMSPHALVQEFLNRSEHLWGIVTNGRVLRLLRTSTRVRRQAYVEFDLEAIFGQNRFEDFVLLYRLLHRTRLPQGIADAPECWLERYHRQAIEQGNRVRDRLRDGVEEALKILGTALLRHAARHGHDIPSARAFHHDLLRLVYRFLFLLVAEDRGLLGGNDLYREHYSISRLRRLVDNRRAYTEHVDLWLSLSVLWDLLRDDTPVPQLGDRPKAALLGLSVLDGELFEPLSLDNWAVSNRDLLTSFYHLVYYYDAESRVTRRVNYAALDVEELGSIYESLLDLQPQILHQGGEPTFTFVEGTERKSTGSYYTPHELVDELVRSALEPVMEERLAEARRMASGEWRMVESEWEKIPQDLRGRWTRDVLSRLQGSGSVATGHVYRQSGLQAHPGLSSQRNVRDDRTDAAGSDIHSRKHRGGMGETIHRGVHPVHPQGERKPSGTGDLPDAERGRGPVSERGRAAPAGGLASPGETVGDAGAPSLTEEEIAALWPKLPFPIRYSLFAEYALLSIKVLDPAAGSGHFLLAAARRLGKELARVRTGEEEPAPEAVREAVRDVIAHCIYGVDKNPMAVELCKVALWIEGHVPGKPLTFLDHRIKCGDSLVGVLDLSVLQQGIPDDAYAPKSGDDKGIARGLKKRNKQEREGQSTMVSGETALNLTDVSDLADEFATFATLVETTASDVRAKAALYAELRGSEQWRRWWMACNLWMAPFFTPLTREHAARVPTTAEVHTYMENPAAVDRQMLAWAEALAVKHRFFHWPLEFPDVFVRGGFDVVLGNPPFMGGLKISGTLGPRYRHWLQVAYVPFKGTADLAAAFYRRAYRLLHPGGLVGMVATNTIGQGDTRESGLKVIVGQGGTITFARRFIKWTGAANVEVNLVAIHKPGHSPSATDHSPILDGTPVSFISSRLDPEPEAEPRRLPQNEGKAFIGDYVRGIGFVLAPEEAEALLAKDPRNRACLFPYLNGEDLNSHPEQKPSRWVICFHDWPLERAKQYPDLLRIVEERVKPVRERLRGPGDKRNREFWWQFGAYRSGMRQAIAPLRRVLVRSRVSELHALVFVDKGWIYNEQTIVFAFDDDYHFALLQSNVHEVWLRHQASSLRTDVRYTPTDCFGTFPFPPEEYRRVARGEWRMDALPEPFRWAAEIGTEYHEHRRQIMLTRNTGLTKTYNLFHTPSCADSDIQRLRELHVEMDRAILACYGWEDLDLQHSFYQNERGQTRFMPSAEARWELLRRLLELNLQIAAQEAR